MKLFDIFNPPFKLTQKETNKTQPDILTSEVFGINMELRKKYATTLLLHNYGYGSEIQSHYPVYFEKECSISNPKILHQTLISDGLLEPASIKTRLENLKIPELKSILESIGVKKTGKKEELIQRIIAESDFYALQNFFSNQECFALSTAGTMFLEEHKDYIELHRNSLWAITIEEYENIKKKYKSNNFYENITPYFHDKLKTATSYQFRLTHYYLFQIYHRKKDFENAMRHILFVLHWDVNSIDNYPHTDLRHYYKISKKDFQKEYPVSLFAPGIISKIVTLKNYYSESLVNEVYHDSCFDKCLCDQKTFLKILEDIFNTISFPYEKWNSYFEKKFYQSFKW